MIRKLSLSLVIASAVTVVAMMIPSGAMASSYGCSGASCLRINGTGLQVNYIEVSWTQGALMTNTGHFQTWDGGMSLNTPDKVYKGVYGRSVVWTYRYNVNRKFANNTKICGTFWSKSSSGGYWDMGIPCKNVTA